MKAKKEQPARLFIDEAIAKHNENITNPKELLSQAQVIAHVWPDRDYRSAWQALNKLRRGGFKTVDILVARRLCEITGVSMDFLFGISK